MVLALPPSPLGVLLSACHFKRQKCIYWTWQQRNAGVVTCELKCCQNRTWTKPIIQPNHGSNNMPLFFSFFFLMLALLDSPPAHCSTGPPRKLPLPDGVSDVRGQNPYRQRHQKAQTEIYYLTGRYIKQGKPHELLFIYEGRHEKNISE